MADHLSLDTSPAASRKAKGQPAVRKPAAPRTLSLAEQNAAIRERTGAGNWHGSNSSETEAPAERGVFAMGAPRGFVRLSARDDDGNEVASLLLPADVYDSYHVEVLQDILDRCDPLGRPRPGRGLTLVPR
jgi:hypothetical protein